MYVSQFLSGTILRTGIRGHFEIFGPAVGPGFKQMCSATVLVFPVGTGPNSREGNGHSVAFTRSGSRPVCFRKYIIEVQRLQGSMAVRGVARSVPSESSIAVSCICGRKISGCSRGDTESFSCVLFYNEQTASSRF